MATHPAVIATGLKQPLTVAQVPTPPIQQGEVRVRVEWVPSAPLDVFQVDAGLMHYKVSDQVFGFFFHNEKERAQQIYVTAPEHLFARAPTGVPLASAATLPNNFCTAFFTLSEKLGVELPWPRPEGFASKNQDIPIIIWGASSSVGQYAVQILKYWGYTNVIGTASAKHHGKVKSYGANHVFDYRDSAVVHSISEIINAKSTPNSIRVFDCVDSKFGSLLPISMIATQPGSIVAALLPVIISAPSAQNSETPLQLTFDVSKEAAWAPEIETHRVATYTYEANAFLKNNLQPVIMSTLLAQGIIEPNKQQVVEGKALLDRAQKALNIMRSGAVSGEARLEGVDR
ncbi:alcohol dehydrogenase [Halenospora varia]|nr:alcohol dehydrogenase [Halenospora varia]